jgi:hypothetical protein
MTEQKRTHTQETCQQGRVGVSVTLRSVDWALTRKALRILSGRQARGSGPSKSWEDIGACAEAMTKVAAKLALLREPMNAYLLLALSSAMYGRPAHVDVRETARALMRETSLQTRTCGPVPSPSAVCSGGAR